GGPEPAPRPADDERHADRRTGLRAASGHATATPAAGHPPGERSAGVVRPAVGAALAALVATALSVAVSGSPAPAWELDVVDAATRLPDAIGYPLRGVMQLGTTPAALAAGLVVWFVVERWRPALTVTAAGLLASLVATRAKLLVDRDRPSGVRIREAHDTLGFPSGHTAVAVALAVAVAALLPRRWRLVAYGAGALVGVARMHVGVHFPLDVVGGALIGVAAGLGVRAVVNGPLADRPRRGPPGRSTRRAGPPRADHPGVR
ncbi:MAG: phosphatase PAP2 family protein, partial [Acidimicrobiia bacterium]